MTDKERSRPERSPKALYPVQRNSMQQHIPFHAIFIALTMTAASAGPLALTQDGNPVIGIARPGVAAPPQRPADPVPVQAYAQANQGPQNLGPLGFFELLFGGAGNRVAPQRYESDYGPSAYAPSGEPAYPATDPRYLKQEVRYDGSERPGTIIIDTNERLLYLVREGGRAIRYGI